ncbi:MAG: dephospho-CoA kinase [Desulfovibrionaceae bacterium]|nr:dephospho-CoA kinase [Desulfovibrionaceae bacterium]
MRNSFRFAARVDAQNVAMRLDRFVAMGLPQISRSRIREAIVRGACTLDGLVCARPDRRLKEGEDVACSFSLPSGSLVPWDGPLDIIFRDEYLCVVNKPAGMTVHPCPSCSEKTLVHRLLSFFPQLASMDGERPGIVHRLDKDTSGLLLVALNEPVRLLLVRAFARRAVKKTYLALVSGVPQESGECSDAIGRHPVRKVAMCVLPEARGGRSAHTAYLRLWLAPNGRCSLLSITIATGRTHQIRVHMSHIGHPLLGDQVYAPKEIAAMAPRQMLHAQSLSFTHPVTGESCSLSAPPPDDFIATAERACRTVQRVILTGNPGSGKSTVLRFFRTKGVPTFSADCAVHELYAEGGPVSEWLRMQGKACLCADNGTVLRDALREYFLTDPVFKRDLETLVHASVREKLAAFFKDCQGECAVAEVPLWFECGWQDQPVVTVCVFCGQDLRFERLRTTRGWTRERSLAIEAWQWAEERKAKASDYVLRNDGDTSALEKACAACFHWLTLEREKKRTRAMDAFRACLRSCP